MAALHLFLSSSFSGAVPRQLRTRSAPPIPKLRLLEQKRQGGPISIRAEASSVVNGGSESWDWLPPLPEKMDLLLLRQKMDLTKPNVPLADKLYLETMSELFILYHRLTYTYAAMYAHFHSPDIGLHGFAKFSMESSFRAWTLGGVLQLLLQASSSASYHEMGPAGSVVSPQPGFDVSYSGFDHPEKGHALNAMETALTLEELRHEKLLKLRTLAQRCSHPALDKNIIDSEFLSEKETGRLNKISGYVAQLRISGEDGPRILDEMLLRAN